MWTLYQEQKLYQLEEKGVPLSEEQGGWLADTDDEPDEQEIGSTLHLHGNDPGDMCDNEGQADQNAENPEDERMLIASLIANFKLDLAENKKSQRQLKKANTSITQEPNKSKQDLKKTKQDIEKSKQDLKKTKQDLEISKHNLTYPKVSLRSTKFSKRISKRKEKVELNVTPPTQK
ncbi:hypothetical protein Tco_0580172 [Tanacetum coccineum]